MSCERNIGKTEQFKPTAQQDAIRVLRDLKWHQIFGKNTGSLDNEDYRLKVIWIAGESTEDPTEVDYSSKDEPSKEDCYKLIFYREICGFQNSDSLLYPGSVLVNGKKISVDIIIIKGQSFLEVHPSLISLQTLA